MIHSDAIDALSKKPNAAKKLRALLEALEGEDEKKRNAELKTGSVRILRSLLESRNENTSKAYRLDLEMFARWLGAPNIGTAIVAMLKCDQGHLNEMLLRYRKQLEVSSASSATINHRLVAIRECFRIGRQFGITMLSVEVKGLPAQKTKNMKGPPVEKVLEVLRKLKASNRPTDVRDHCILCFYFYMALRATEALGIDFPEHVDLNRGAVKILGKARRLRQEIGLPAPALESLTCWLQVRGMHSGPLFCRTRTWTNTVGPQRVTRHTIFNRMQDLGLFRIHALRHTAATAASNLGRPIQDIQALLRHASPATTARYLDNPEEKAISVSTELGKKFGI